MELLQDELSEVNHIVCIIGGRQVIFFYRDLTFTSVFCVRQIAEIEVSVDRKTERLETTAAGQLQRCLDVANQMESPIVFGDVEHQRHRLGHAVRLIMPVDRRRRVETFEVIVVAADVRNVVKHSSMLAGPHPRSPLLLGSQTRSSQQPQALIHEIRPAFPQRCRLAYRLALDDIPLKTNFCTRLPVFSPV